MDKKRLKNAKKCEINYDAKCHFASSKNSRRFKPRAIFYFLTFATLIAGVSHLVVDQLIYKVQDKYYAATLPHEIFEDGHHDDVSFDDINEDDILTVTENADGTITTTVKEPENKSSENVLLTDNIAVDPDLFEVTEHILDDSTSEFRISPNSTTQYTIRPGDSLSKILNYLGFKANDVNNFIADKEVKKQLRNISPGQHLEIKTDDSNSITKVIYHYSLLESYQAELKDEQWVGETIINEHTVETREVAAVIISTLNAAASDKGISRSVVNKLNSIFKERINLSKDIRAGDTFAIIYEYLYINGKPYKPSNVLAAEIIVQGKKYTAIRHAADDRNSANYYDIHGKPLVSSESFRRHPVDGVRITSKFGQRFHPVLKRQKMHNGVDYGAKRGTPIYAVADGKVEFAGRRGSYGNAIITKHSSGYKSLFAHMSRVAKGVKNGSYVKKGQVVGYVGSTGRSTGPHLHYELIKNGQRINPLTANLPKGNDIPSKQRSEFLASAKAYQEQIDSLYNQQLAQSNDKKDSNTF